MKNALRIAAVCLTLIGLSCCGAGLLDEMDRVTADPTISAPKAVSFVTENQIGLSWDSDKAADLYVLERANDAPNPAYKEVYRGTAVSFTDADVADQSRFLYRLNKVKGEKAFGPSGAVMGIGSATCGDVHEPNDTWDQATPIDYHGCFSNLFYYRSYSGLEVQDADWYSVIVPPAKNANIVVTQITPGITGQTATYMYRYLKGTPPEQIINSLMFQIPNPNQHPETFIFKIFPEPPAFFNDPTLAGGTVIYYKIWLESITS